MCNASTVLKIYYYYNIIGIGNKSRKLFKTMFTISVGDSDVVGGGGWRQTVKTRKKSKVINDNVRPEVAVSRVSYRGRSWVKVVGVERIVEPVCVYYTYRNSRRWRPPRRCMRSRTYCTRRRTLIVDLQRCGVPYDIQKRAPHAHHT